MNKIHPREARTWPGYILGGRLRTSTLVLIIAFLGVGWLYETYEPAATPQQIPASEVVPPGFIPDPNYTWAPRTDVQRQAPKPTTPTTTSTTPTTASTTPTSPIESGASPTPEPTPSSSPAPTTASSPAPSSAPSTPESAAPSTPEKPAAQSPSSAVPAGGATPTPAPSTR